MIDDYFTNNWKPDYSKFKLSGWNLINKIGKDETILDVGCGYNLFKPIFGDRLYGIDPFNPHADEQVSIEDFEAVGQWDVLFILGSLNFGDRLEVRDQIGKAFKYLKPGGRAYWRQNPGIGDHPWKGVEDIQFYPWTFQDNLTFAKDNGCEVVDLRWDTGHRIYSEWVKHANVHTINH